ncbi:MAG: nitroreductase family protein [Mycobacterium sp.]
MTLVDHDPALRPWQLDEADYPSTGPMSERVVFLLRYAVLAPSGHNTQPWQFRVDNNRLQVRADRSRCLSVVDPDDRELVISCGAALETLRVAARHFGLDVGVDLFPDTADPDLLANLRLEPGVPPSVDDNTFFGAITRRRTNRRPFADRPLPEALVQQLVTDAQDVGARLYPVDIEQRQQVAALIADGTTIQMADKGFRRELAAWLRPNASHHIDGMRAHGFGFGDLISHVVPLVIRNLDLGKSQAAKDRALVDGSPLLAVIGTDTDSPLAWLLAGQALQRTLLRCCAAGVSASFLNQPIEVDHLRSRLAGEVAGGSAPQLLLRLGYGPPVDPQPRRPIEACCTAGNRQK